MNTNFKTVLIVVSVILSTVLPFKQVLSQGVAINENAADPHASAVLDVSSTEKGLLIPRMSTNERTSISNPAKGLMVFDNDLSQFWFFDGTSWTAIGGGDNIYTANDTLSDNRTVTHNNKNLTFTTGTGKLEVNGNLQMGALYGSIRTQALPLVESDWTATDFSIRITGDGSLELPNPATNSGRIISLRNSASANKTITANPPLNNGTITLNRGMILQSDGTNWHVIGGF